MTNDKTPKPQRYDDLLPDLRTQANDDKQAKYAEQRRNYREQNPVIAAQYKL